MRVIMNGTSALFSREELRLSFRAGSITQVLRNGKNVVISGNVEWEIFEGRRKLSRFFRF